MIKQFLVWCVAILSLVSFGDNIPVLHAQTRTTYRVNLIHLPGFVNSADEGLGVRLNQEILRRIEQSEGLRFTVSFYPAKRSFIIFNEGDADLIFPTVLGTDRDDPFSYQSPETIDSGPVVGSGYVILTLTRMPQLSALGDLVGKTVGVIRGNTLPRQLDDIAVKEIQEVASMEQNIAKLRAARIDAILVLKALGFAEIRRLKVSDIHYGREFHYVFGGYTAHLSQEGARLIEYLNQAIGELIKDGTYQDILKDDQQSLLDCNVLN